MANPKQHIVLLDPSIKDTKGSLSDNLGDVIIFESIIDIINKIFPDKEVIRISTHIEFGSKQKKIINNAFFCFAGGSNMLSSDIRNFPKMTTHKKKGFYFFPGIKNIILLGVGWNNYQSNPDWASRFYYNNILHKDFFHSVRDTYTLRKIEKIKQIKAINTSCPSLWSINAEFKNSYNLEFKKILFTVNGYHSSPETDNNVLKLLFESGNNEIVFFPQGKIDSEYFSNLDFFRINKNKFTILDHNFDEFKKILKGGHINYIGSRLHGGIKCLQYNIPTAILGFDNRSLEIKKDTILNVIEKNNLNNLREWIEGKFIPPKISLPYENINIWKNQFK